MIHIMDWLPTLLTFLKVSKTELPDDLDGIDQSSYLFANYPREKSNRNEFFYHNQVGTIAYRWLSKLITLIRPN